MITVSEIGSWVQVSKYAPESSHDGPDVRGRVGYVVDHNPDMFGRSYAIVRFEKRQHSIMGLIPIDELFSIERPRGGLPE